jgi:hypothetical protein
MASAVKLSEEVQSVLNPQLTTVLPVMVIANVGLDTPRTIVPARSSRRT